MRSRKTPKRVRFRRSGIPTLKRRSRSKMDNRSLGSSRASKKRLPLPSGNNELASDGDLLSLISGESEIKSSSRLQSATDELDLLSHFSSDSKTSRSSKAKSTTKSSRSGKGGSSLLLGSSGDHHSEEQRSTGRSGSLKSGKSRKTLPLPSQIDSNDILSSLLSEEGDSSTSVFSKKEARLAPRFANNGHKTLADEGSEHELLERLSNLSSQSGKSRNSKRNLPRPSNTLNQQSDDLLAFIQNEPDTRSNGYQDSESTQRDNDQNSEHIVYEPADSEDMDEDYEQSPRDDVKQAIDVLSLLSGQEGGIKPRVLTHRGKYSDEGSTSEIQSESSHERAESKVSGTGYMSDRSASTRGAGSIDSLAASANSGKQWNQNRAYFLRTAKMREKKNANSPLAKWLPGGAMSSSGVEKEKSAETVLENEMIEQLQLELEEARRTIRGHESKILQLQDEVDQARESCMEEECERVEAEIAKERVHNENRMLKIQLSEMASLHKSPPRTMSAEMRPLSAGQSVIETQTDESFLRECKSAADMGAYAKMERRAVQQKTLRRKIGSEDDIREMLSDEEFTSDLDQADGIILNPGPVRSSTQNQIAIPFKVNTRSYKWNLITQMWRGMMHDDFSCSLYKT